MVVVTHNKFLYSEVGLTELPIAAGVGGIRLFRNPALHNIWKSRHWPFFTLKYKKAFILIPVH